MPNRSSAARLRIALDVVGRRERRPPARRRRIEEIRQAAALGRLVRDAFALDPLGAWMVREPRRDPVTDTRRGADAMQVDRLGILTEAHVVVTVDHARHHGVARGIDLDGCRTRVRTRLTVVADPRDGSGTDRDRARGGPRIVDGEDLGVADENVGRSVGHHACPATVREAGRHRATTTIP